jgi:hypothetical protein
MVYYRRAESKVYKKTAGNYALRVFYFLLLVIL